MVEGELFRGRPDWSRLHAYPRPRLSDDEQRFLDNQAEEACRMVNDWEVTQERFDLPADVWNYLKSQGFLGMIIPKSYGGLGFSAYAHSEIVTAVDPLVGAGRVGHGAELLGPAELLLHYGTDAQKNHYLPRLARGEVPAFALTSPWPVGRRRHSRQRHRLQGRMAGPRSGRHARHLGQALHHAGAGLHLLGLAFRLYDPDGLLGDEKDLASPARWCRTTTPASTRAAATSR